MRSNVQICSAKLVQPCGWTPRLKRLRIGTPVAPVMAGAVSALHVRAIKTVRQDDRVGRSAEGRGRAEDRRGQQ